MTKEATDLLHVLKDSVVLHSVKDAVSQWPWVAPDSQLHEVDEVQLQTHQSVDGLQLLLVCWAWSLNRQLLKRNVGKSYSLSLSLSLTNTHTHTLWHTLTPSLPLTLSLPPPLTHTYSLTHPSTHSAWILVTANACLPSGNNSGHSHFLHELTYMDLGVWPSRRIP